MQELNMRKAKYHIVILNELASPTLNKEREHIIRMIDHAYNELYKICVYINPYPIQMLHIKGIPKSILRVDAILYIRDKIEENPNFKAGIDWIKKRTYKKANINDKNIIILYLLMAYPTYFINYLKEFLSDEKVNEEDTTYLIANLENILKKYSINSIIQPSINSDNNEESKEPKNQELTNQENDTVTNENVKKENDFLDGNSKNDVLNNDND